MENEDPVPVQEPPKDVDRATDAASLELWWERFMKLRLDGTADAIDGAR